MGIFKMPSMKKPEYDKLIEEGYICRIVFRGDDYPYIAPFLYVFDGKILYFLSTKYGKKLQHFKKHPYVTVEVEQYTPDLSNFSFVSIPGRLEEVEDPELKNLIRQNFVELIKARNLSSNVLSALGHSPVEPVNVLLTAENNIVWRLVNVKVRDIVGLKHSEYP